MEGFWASLRAKKACNKTVHSTTLFYYYSRLCHLPLKVHKPIH